MTAPMSGIQNVLSRITAIETQLQALAPQPSAPTTSASSADFSSLLDSVSNAGSTSPATDSSAATGKADAAVTAAKSYLGVPYVWGAEGRKGIDCSGLTQSAYKAAGIDIPRVAKDQQKIGTPVASLDEAKPGDLIFYGNPAHHVAMYIGDGKLIEAPQAGETVSIRPVYGHPTIRRVVPSTDTASTASAFNVNALTALSSNPKISAAVQAYSAQFKAAEAKYGLPTGLLEAVAQQESGGNVHAVSKAGAQGLMQFMPSTAAGLGVNPLDPASAINGAGKMYAGLLTKYHGSIPLALAAYNAGSGAVDKYGGIPPYNETQNYVRKIMALMSAGGQA